MSFKFYRLILKHDPSETSYIFKSMDKLIGFEAKQNTTFESLEILVSYSEYFDVIYPQNRGKDHTNRILERLHNTERVFFNNLPEGEDFNEWIHYHKQMPRYFKFME